MDMISLPSLLILSAAVKIILLLILFFVGIILCRWLGWLVALILKSVRLDRGAKLAGIDKILEKGEVKKSISELLGEFCYWAAVLVFLFWVAGLIGIPADIILIKIINYSAVIFSAVFILGVGLFLASMVSGAARAIMLNLGLEGAKTASRLIYYIVIVIVFISVLEELGISAKVFEPQIGVIIGAFGLAAAIAFGLGCKDMAADFLHNLFKGR